MPFNLPHLPDVPSAPVLSEDAGVELPQGDKPLSSSKGSFAVWVIRWLSWGLVLALGIMFWMSRQEITDLKISNKQLITSRDGWQEKYLQRILSENNELKNIKDTVATMKTQVQN